MLLAFLEIGATWWLGDSFVRGTRVGTNWGVVGTIDGQLGWVNQPRGRGHVSNELFEYDVRINALGFRDRERDVSKGAGMRRVLVLGDSVAWGWGVNDGERFSDRLEQQLGPGVEVLNLAVPGYGSDQSLWNLEQRGWDFDPDLVLYCFVINDILESELDRYAGMPKPRFVRDGGGAWVVERPAGLGGPPSGSARAKALAKWLQANSALVAALTVHRVAQDPGQDPAHLSYHAARPEQTAVVRQLLAQIDDPAAPVHHALSELAKTCEAHGTPVLVTSVAFGHDQHLYEPRFPAPEGISPEGYRADLALAIDQAAGSLHFQAISVDEAMLRHCRAGERLHCGDGHPNAQGHQVVAETLAPEVRKALSRLALNDLASR